MIDPDRIIRKLPATKRKSKKLVRGFGEGPELREPPVCPRPDKQQYRTERRALRDLANKGPQMAKSGLVPYQCACGYWHLGHKGTPIGLLYRMVRVDRSHIKQVQYMKGNLSG